MVSRSGLNAVLKIEILAPKEESNLSPQTKQYNAWASQAAGLVHLIIAFFK
jgi:hypothetical protein